MQNAGQGGGFQNVLADLNQFRNPKSKNMLNSFDKTFFTGQAGDFRSRLCAAVDYFGNGGRGNYLI